MMMIVVMMMMCCDDGVSTVSIGELVGEHQE